MHFDILHNRQVSRLGMIARLSTLDCRVSNNDGVYEDAWVSNNAGVYEDAWVSGKLPDNNSRRLGDARLSAEVSCDKGASVVRPLRLCFHGHVLRRRILFALHLECRL